MSSENLTAFNDIRSIYTVIGSICEDATLLRESENHLEPNDFMQSIHKVIYGAINNIVYNASGDKVTKISAKDIDNHLSNQPISFKTWNDQKGYDYVNYCIEHANKENFWQSHDRIKKMALLREYQTAGFDVSELYDWKSDDFAERDRMMKKLDAMKQKDISEHFTLKNLKIKDKHNIETEVKQFKAGDDINDLISGFKEEKVFGYPYGNGYENFLMRGMLKGKFILRSGNTGTMKTSLAIADMTRTSVGKIYENGKWVDNGESLPSLFISTELDKIELTVIVLAHMTGISRRIIMDGDFNKEQEVLLREAGEILSNSPFYLVHIPDFSVADIEEIIERHILDHDVQYIAFDYIQNVPKLQRTTNEMFGSTQREDQVLLHLSSSLKMLAEKYDVFIESSTQLNRGAKEDINRDASALRGSSAVADKIDAGMLLFRVKDADKEKVKTILEDSGFGSEPNFMRWMYKNRNGQANVIIWSKLDFSTVREKPLFVTDFDYNIVTDVKDLTLEVEKTNPDKKLELDIDKINKTVSSIEEDMDF